MRIANDLSHTKSHSFNLDQVTLTEPVQYMSSDVMVLGVFSVISPGLQGRTEKFAHCLVQKD